MKATLFAFFIALLMGGCGEPDLSDPDVLEDASDGAVDWSKLEWRNWVMYLQNEEIPFTGRAKRFYKNGQNRREANFKDGKMDGLWTEWYENGQKKLEENYKDGKVDGLWTTWYENGQKKTEGNWKDGKKDGLWTYWYENGQKELEVTYKDNKRDGSFTYWYENGQTSNVGTYEDDKPMSAKGWKPNGEKCPVTKFKDGNGVVVEYNEDGTEYKRLTYKDGELVK